MNTNIVDVVLPSREPGIQSSIYSRYAGTRAAAWPPDFWALMVHHPEIEMLQVTELRLISFSYSWELSDKMSG